MPFASAGDDEYGALPSSPVQSGAQVE